MQLEQIFDEIIRIGTKYPEYAVGSLIPFFSLFMGIFTRQYRTRSSMWILWFIILFIVTDFPLWVTAAMKIHNLMYKHTRQFGISIFLFLIYFIKVKHKIDKFILIVFLGIMLIGMIIQLASIIPKGQYQWINGFLLGSVSVWYFVRLLEFPKIRDILSYPFFWFNSGILFYCFSTLLIYFFFQFTVDSDIKGRTYFMFHTFLEYLTSIMFIFFAIGFLNLKRNAQIIRK